MPVRSPAQCRRTVAPKALASHTGVWVTDSMLRQAIERYHRRFVVQCRRISSHSGPLESRRRLGKRQMTGIMPSSSAYPPIWHFEVASIPGVWKWEPPNTPDERRRKKQDLSVPGLFNSFIGWLEKPDADKPFIQPPLDDAATVLASSAEAIALDVAGEELVMPETTQSEFLAPTELPKEVLKFRTSIGLLDVVDDDTLYGLCKTCRRSLRRRIERGDISVEGLLLVMEPLDQAAKSRISDRKTANRLAAMIRRSILSAMQGVQSNNPTALLQQLWMAFAAKICAANGSNHDLQLFWRTMCAMPGLLRAQIPSDQIFALTRSFVTAQASRHNLFAHWSARAARFADILPRLSAAQRENLESDMRAFLLQEDTASEARRRMRFSWLTIKAYDASTTGQTFVDLYQDLIQVDGVRMNSLQIWLLMVGRLQSTGVFEEAEYSNLMKAEYISTAQRWTSLVTTALRSSNADAGLRELCACLRGIGETEVLTHALTSQPIHRLQMDVLQAVAMASDDHRLTLQLYEALESKAMAGGQLRPWPWTFWLPYVERIVKDPEIEPLRIWLVLNLARRHSHNESNPDENGIAQETKAKMELLDQMGRWYMESAHLNDRQVLRRVQKCMAMQRALTGAVSSRTLANAMEVVTRDLDKGEMGRTTRLQWLVGVVADTHGPKDAEHALAALKGWRWMIDRGDQGNSP